MCESRLSSSTCEMITNCTVQSRSLGCLDHRHLTNVSIPAYPENLAKEEEIVLFIGGDKGPPDKVGNCEHGDQSAITKDYTTQSAVPDTDYTMAVNSDDVIDGKEREQILKCKYQNQSAVGLELEYQMVNNVQEQQLGISESGKTRADMASLGFTASIAILVGLLMISLTPGIMHRKLLKWVCGFMLVVTFIFFISLYVKHDHIRSVITKTGMALLGGTVTGALAVTIWGSGFATFGVVAALAFLAASSERLLNLIMQFMINLPFQIKTVWIKGTAVVNRKWTQVTQGILRFSGRIKRKSCEDDDHPDNKFPRV